MHYKKFFSATALVTLLSLSHSAFSDPVGPISDEETSYYVRLQYNGEFLPLYTKVDGITGAKKDSKETKDLYAASFKAVGGAFGYKMDDIRVDIELLYSQLGKDKDVTGADPEIASDLMAASALANVYYDIAIEDMPITPYVGVGVGVAGVSTPLNTVVSEQKYKFGVAYQAKAGVSYDVTPEIKLFAGARYFGSYGASFQKNADDTNKNGLKVLYSTVGAEAGVAFNF